MTVKIGRLAMRREGKWWNAYYAMPETMTDAILLGSIAMRFVESEAVSDLIQETTGVRPIWPEGPQPAPEHEKAGHS